MWVGAISLVDAVEADARPQLRSVSRADAALGIRARLTVGEARALCEAVRAALAAGRRSLVVDMRETVAMDAAGLAALLHSHRLAGLTGVSFAIVPGARVERQLVDARVLEELDIARTDVVPAATHRVEPAAGPAVIAAAGRVTLRQPRLDDLPAFRDWGRDGFVDQMVGSPLLYRCRHLPIDDPILLDVVAHDPRSVTAVIESPVAKGPLGFVRLHEIDLAAGFAFLETVVVEPQALRRGIGIEASRLLVAWAMDALAIRRVEAKVYASNLLSINALRRNGFQQEGVLREARIYEQQAWDILVFAILEREMRRERAAEQFASFAFFPELEEGPA